MKENMSEDSDKKEDPTSTELAGKLNLNLLPRKYV